MKTLKFSSQFWDIYYRPQNETDNLCFVILCNHCCICYIHMCPLGSCLTGLLFWNYCRLGRAYFAGSPVTRPTVSKHWREQDISLAWRLTVAVLNLYQLAGQREWYPVYKKFCHLSGKVSVRRTGERKGTTGLPWGTSKLAIRLMYMRLHAELTLMTLHSSRYTSLTITYRLNRYFHKLT